MALGQLNINKILQNRDFEAVLSGDIKNPLIVLRDLKSQADANFPIAGETSTDIIVEQTIGNGIDIQNDTRVKGSLSKKGTASTTGYGLMNISSISASKSMNGGATENIDIQIPLGAKVLGVSLRVDSAITFGGGGTSWDAAYNTGSTQVIVTSANKSKNTKVDVMFDSNAATDILTAATDITITPSAGTLATGVITAVAYYISLTSLTNA